VTKEQYYIDIDTPVHKIKIKLPNPLNEQPPNKYGSALSTTSTVVGNSFPLDTSHKTTRTSTEKLDQPPIQFPPLSSGILNLDYDAYKADFWPAEIKSASESPESLRRPRDFTNPEYLMTPSKR